MSSVKMILMSVMTVSMIYVRLINALPAAITYGDVEIKSKSAASLVAMEHMHRGRDSNLRYVMAIKNSSCWTEIKTRSLTINTEPKTGDIIDESPKNLSDQELLQLKKVCQDGLKCVAVDHLLILTQVMKTSGGKTSVRTAITNITKVLTQYTSEYHENTYQYEEVTDKDDADKVYSSVTTIVQDNEELCRTTSPGSDEISYSTSNVKYYRRGVETFDGKIDNGAADESGKDDATLAVVDDSANGAHAQDDPSTPEDDDQNKRPPQGKSAQDDDDFITVTVVPAGKSTGIETAGNAKPQNPDGAKQTDAADPVAADNNAAVVIGSPKTAGPSVASETVRDSVGAPRDAAKPNSNVTGVINGDNSVLSTNNQMSDIVTTGRGTSNNVDKGYVQDGNLNNGDMKTTDFNGGVENKGVISNSTTKGGILNVGTVNNGKTNYGTVNNRVNTGLVSNSNNTDIQQFIKHINNIYVTMLTDLAGK